MREFSARVRSGERRRIELEQEIGRRGMREWTQIGFERTLDDMESETWLA